MLEGGSAVGDKMRKGGPADEMRQDHQGEWLGVI